MPWLTWLLNVVAGMRVPFLCMAEERVPERSIGGKALALYVANSLSRIPHASPELPLSTERVPHFPTLQKGLRKIQSGMDVCFCHPSLGSDPCVSLIHSLVFRPMSLYLWAELASKSSFLSTCIEPLILLSLLCFAGAQGGFRVPSSGP